MLYKQICGYGIDLTHDKVWCNDMKQLENLLNHAPEYKKTIVRSLDEIAPITDWTAAGVFEHINPDNALMGLATVLANVINEAANVPVEAIEDYADSDNVLLAYTIDDTNNAYWESDQQKKLDEVFDRFVGIISDKRFFAGYVLWCVPVEAKREFCIDTPLGKLKVYSKHEKDTPEDYPGVYVAYVDPNTMKETVLTMVEYDHYGANDGGSIYTRVYGNGLLEEPTESVCHEHLAGYDLALAKKLICDFCQREFGPDDISSFDNLERVELAFTYTTDDLLGIQVCVDLVHYTISNYVQSSIHEEPFEFLINLKKYDSLADLCDYLECMRVEDLIAIPDSSWTKFCCSKIGLKWLRDEFRKGTRIKLSWMNDQQAPPSGAIGTVEFVDDMGNIHMRWDTGSSLSLCYGIDKFYEAKEKGGLQA